MSDDTKPTHALTPEEQTALLKEVDEMFSAFVRAMGGRNQDPKFRAMLGLYLQRASANCFVTTGQTLGSFVGTAAEVFATEYTRLMTGSEATARAAASILTEFAHARGQQPS